MAGPRFAYWIKGASVGQIAQNPPARLRAAWPKNPSEPLGCWMAHVHPSGDGVLCVFPRLDGAAARLEEFGTPRETADGMVFYPSLVEPTTEFLIKPEIQRGPGEWVSTYLGHSLWVPLALAAPRRLLLTSSGIHPKQPVSELGRIAHEIFDEYFSKEGLTMTDQRLARLIFLALRDSYYVTEEILEDLPWLTDRDLSSIFQTIMGASPKPSPAEHVSSPSAGQTTPTSP